MYTVLQNWFHTTNETLCWQSVEQSQTANTKSACSIITVMVIMFINTVCVDLNKVGRSFSFLMVNLIISRGLVSNITCIVICHVSQADFLVRYAKKNCQLYGHSVVHIQIMYKCCIYATFIIIAVYLESTTPAQAMW